MSLRTAAAAAADLTKEDIRDALVTPSLAQLLEDVGICADDPSYQCVHQLLCVLHEKMHCL